MNSRLDGGSGQSKWGRKNENENAHFRFHFAFSPFQVDEKNENRSQPRFTGTPHQVGTAKMEMKMGRFRICMLSIRI